MTNEAMASSPSDGRFRPESISHFKEVAKNMAWLLERPVQKCQEDLARIYGYSGLHELQQVMKRPGNPGPFDPRYNYLSTDDEGLVEDHDRRIFFILFGVPKRYWRDDVLASDKSFLVFEMGLFQEASEHRACVEKIRQVLIYQVGLDRWPLIHGWPLGLKSLLASRYTEPMQMAKDWIKVLHRSRCVPILHADICYQRRMTGLARLDTLFEILIPRVNGRKPNGMGKVAFDEFNDDGGGLVDPSWEEECLVEWLMDKGSAKNATASVQQEDQIRAFVRRPSRSTAAACEFVKDMKDPVGFRDRWAFESFKAVVERRGTPTKALFSSILDEGAIYSVFLHMDWESADLSESVGQLWEFNYTRTDVIEPEEAGGAPTLQPVIHANGSLIVPFDSRLVAWSDADWYLIHDASSFASEAAAETFEKIYLRAIGVKQMDFVHRRDPYSIVEIDDILVAPHITVESLKSYFSHLLASFEGNSCLPDSYGYWCETLDLCFECADENSARNQDGEYADYVEVPAVLLINIPGCGITFVEATHLNGRPVSILRSVPKAKVTPSGEALANMVMEAVKGLAVDVVVYDDAGF